MAGSVSVCPRHPGHHRCVTVLVSSHVGITLAFRHYRPALGLASPWVQNVFENFWFFSDPEFWHVLGNTVKISAVKFVFLFPAPIILALMTSEVRAPGFKGVVQSITYLPHFVSWVIMAGVFHAVFSYRPNSPINAIRAIMGLGATNVMTDERYFLPMLVVSALIKEVGWGTIIYLAAIANVDPQLYELPGSADRSVRTASGREPHLSH